MTSKEYKAWKDDMKRNAGHWATDAIHNSANDYLAYVAQPDDPARGIFVTIDERFLRCGKFEDALPHMGEATYHTGTFIECKDNNAAWKVAIERLGLSFLLSITHGASPYRTAV